ncbi:MAG: hypothetical protein RLY71_3669 [Pseudomonadota bacterium]|jgi:hypothetical protein
MLSDEQFDKLSRFAERKLAAECARLIAPYRGVVRQELREMMAAPRQARPAEPPSVLRQLLGCGPITPHPGR